MKNRFVLLQFGFISGQSLAGIAKFAHEHDWHIVLEDRSMPPTGWHGDGVITSLKSENKALVNFVKGLIASHVPVVDIRAISSELDVPRVIGDHRRVGEVAAEHFEERRFKHIAWFSMEWSNVHRMRFEGLAGSWHGDKPLQWVWSRRTEQSGRDDWDALMSWLRERLAAAPKPLAIVAYNDSDASRVLTAALAAGLSIPEEVAILGIDDESLIVENQQVPLSSVRHDLFRIGYEGAALLERLMDGKKPPREPILIPPRGVSARRSTDVIAVSSPIMRSALDAISQDLSKPLNAAKLAKKIGVSGVALNRLFKTELGTTPALEIRRQRLAHAKVLLTSTDKPIKEIAALCAFRDTAHFTNAFRAATGLTPRAFRKGGR